MGYSYALYRFVPLSRKVYVPDRNIYREYSKESDSEERKVLINKFIDSYGDYKVEDVLKNVILRLESLVKLFDRECRKRKSCIY